MESQEVVLVNQQEKIVETEQRFLNLNFQKFIELIQGIPSTTLAKELGISHMGVGALKRGEATNVPIDRLFDFLERCQSESRLKNLYWSYLAMKPCEFFAKYNSKLGE